MLKIISILTLAASLTYAADTKKAAAPAKKGATKVDLVDGKKVYDTFCVACHGATGKGDGAAAAALNPKPRNFTDAAYMKSRPKETLRKVIAEGGAANGLSPLMAAWKSSIKDPQIDNVLAYVLTLSQSK